MSDDHKLLSTAEKILKQKQEREKQNLIAADKLEDYKKALNSIAASENGSLVFKEIIKAAGIFEPVVTTDAKALLRSHDRNLYLRLIRPFLQPEIRKELEN